MRGAAKLILEHRDKLDELARALLENEVLERDDIERIMYGTPRFQRAPPARACAWSRSSRPRSRSRRKSG